jgi:hypothetical protein
MIVANTLPDGLVDAAPLASILVDEVPALAHPTMLRFEESLEIVAWEIEGEVARGEEVTIHLALRVLGRLPAGTQIYARLLQGRLSRVNGLPHDPAGGQYPPTLWRKGDIIHHTYRFEIPRATTMPGEHDIVIGLRRSEKKNFAITVPEGDVGEHGVRIRGTKKREFAAIGTVDVR